MKVNKLLTSIFIGVVALSSFDVFARADAKQYAEDSLITTKVVSKLTADSSITSKDILTNTYRNNVQLCGFAKDSNEAQLAVNTAKNVDGVKHVYNDLIPVTSLNPNGQYKDYTDDAAITTKVKSTLIGNKQIPMNQISVITQQGYVQLCGFVDNNQIKQNAQQLASSVKGVQSVKNSLRVK